MATRQQVADALKVATTRGDQNDARKLQAWLNSLPASGPEIPSMADMPDAVVTAPATTAPDRTPTTMAQDAGNAAAAVGKQVVGAGETGLSVASGATAGTVAGTGAFLKGVADAILRGDFGTQQAADTIAKGTEAATQAVTYAPRTDAGQAQTAAVGGAAASLAPLAGVMPEIGAAVPPGAAQVVRGAAAEASGAVASGARRVLGRAGSGAPAASDVTGGFGPNSAGSAQAPAAALRQANAEQLGFTGDSRLTKGQITQDRADIGFEAEKAKNAQLGKAFQERIDAQHAQIGKTLDSFVDSTGGSVPDFTGGGKVNLGATVKKALAEGAEKQRAQIKTAYNAAEKEAGANATNLDNLAQVLIDNDSRKGIAPVLGHVEKEAQRLGILVRDENGNLVAQPTTIKQAYQLRVFINDATKQERPDIKAAAQMKAAIDEKIAADGGPLYRQATALSARFKGQYENASLISDLLNTEHGSPDRAIANAQVLDRSILAPSVSVEELKNFRQLLHTHGGAAGIQAWKDLQAGVIEHLKDQATRGTQKTAEGVPIVSADALNKAIRPLDASGKLDFVFGKNDADKLRTLNEVTQSVLVKGGNPSGTSSAVINFLQELPLAGHGVKALRILANHVTDRKLQAKIKEHLR